MKSLLAFVALSLLISCNASASRSTDVQTTGNTFTGSNDQNKFITFEGILIDNSPHDGTQCGISFIHQVAKYRVDKVLNGAYQGKEIVVDHPACNGDVFKDVAIGSRVRITVTQHQHYSSITTHSGIREDNEKPKVFYVAQGVEKVS
jgi:hypothetical protein